MPYIKPENRPQYDAAIQDIASKVECGGDMNYVFTMIAQLYVKKKGLNYQNVSDITSALENCKLEFYRKLIGPYEDTKILENGDVCEISYLTKPKA
jgi:hypothetical protein